MIKRTLALIALFLTTTQMSYADSEPTILPLMCDSSLVSQVRTFIFDVEAKAPKGFNAKLKKMTYRSFDHGSEYAKYVRDRFFSEDNLNQSLISFYEGQGFEGRDSMIRDVVEGVWVNGNKKRCANIQRSMSINGGAVEDITDQPDPEPIKEHTK